MNNKYDTIDETYLENEIGLYNIKNVEQDKYLILFKKIIYSDNQDKIKLIELFLDLLEQQNNIKEFLTIGTFSGNLLVDICILNDDNLFYRILILIKENMLIQVIIKNNAKNMGDNNIIFNTIINCFFTSNDELVNNRLSDNISIKLCGLIGEISLNILNDKSKLFQFTKFIFEIMRTNKLIVIEYLITMYMKYDILEYLIGKRNIDDLDETICIFDYHEIIENISLDLFEQLIYKFTIMDYNSSMDISETLLRYNVMDENNEISKRYMIIYKKIKDKIGMDQILDILNGYNVSQELIDYITHNMEYDIKNAEI